MKVQHTLRTALFGVWFIVPWVWAVGDDRAPLPEPLTLGAALQALDDGHPSIAGSAARKALQQAGLDAAESGYKPSLSLDAGLRYLDHYEPGNDPSQNDSYAHLTLGQTLYDFGRTSGAVEAGQASLEGSTVELRERRNRQAIEVMQRFFDVILADLANMVANEAMSVTYIRKDKSEDRHEMGQLSDIDLFDAERLYQASRTELFRSQAEQRRARVRLALALDRPDQLASQVVRPRLEARERPALNDLIEEVLANAPQLQRQRALVRAAEARIEAARGERWPTLRAEVVGSAHNREIGSRTGPLSASLILEMDLFDGGTRQAQIATRVAELQQQRADLRTAELAAREQATDLWLQLETLGVRRQELDALEDYQELYLDRSRALYELEVTSDLGDAMTKTSEVRLAQAQAEFDLALTWARLDLLRGKTITLPETSE
jgi:outer membrane protein TolC